MALVAKGKLTDVTENHYETARGPQVETRVGLIQEGQDSPTPLIVSYKIVDVVRDLAAAGKDVKVTLFTRGAFSKKSGKAWAEVIIVAAEPA